MIPLLVALLCVLANAFFVAAEFALAKVRPTSLEALAQEGDKKARRALMMTKHLDAYLSATQLGITLASLGLGWLGEPAVADLIEAPLRAVGASPEVIHGVALGVAFSVISIFHIVVGELVPKSLAISRPMQVARHSGLVLRAFHLVMWPFLVLLNGASRLVLRMLRLPDPQHAEGALSVEELRLLIVASHSGGAIDDPQQQIMLRGLRHLDLPVRAVMKPRVDMVVLSLRDPYERQIELVKQYGYTRYPLSTDGEADRIVGYVHIKDLLLVGDPRGDLRRLMRELPSVPMTMTVGEILRELQLAHAPMALVIDEFGGVAGMITLEDAIEEIVGEIQDEHDAEQARMVRGVDGTLSVDAQVPIADLPRAPGDPPWPEEAAGETVASLIIRELEHIPGVGDEVVLGSYVLEVLEVKLRRVRRVRVSARRATPEQDAPEPDRDRAEPRT